MITLRALAPQPRDARDSAEARGPVGTAPYDEAPGYVSMVIIFTMAGVVIVGLYEVITAAGSPVDTDRAVNLDLGKRGTD